MTRRLAPGAALAAIWCTALAAGPLANTEVNDLFVYETYAGFLDDGLWPYRDFPLEYPPLSLVPIWLGSIGGDYELAFGGLMLAAALAVLALTYALARAVPAESDGEVHSHRPALLAAWLVALSPLLLGALVRTHFDLVPVALALAALLALSRDRPLLGFALLGAGAMTKLLPALLVPVAVAWLLGRGRRRQAVAGAAVFALVVAAASLPFAGAGYVDSYEFHLDRPVQIESTPASVLFVLGGSEVTGHPVDPDPYKSNGLRGGADDAVMALFLVLELAALAWIAIRAARRPDARGLVLASFAALLAFVALGKVLSPQFLVWLVPFAALAWAWGERAVAALCAGAMVLTQVEFPARYFDLVDREPAVVAIVAARNGLLLAALVTLLAREAAPARSRRPVAAATPG